MRQIAALLGGFFRRNRRECVFFLVFISAFVVLHSFYYLSKPLGVPKYLQETNTRISSAVINLIAPEEKTFAAGNSIRSGDLQMGIGWGCEGVEGMFMIIAALAAFPLRKKWKAAGMLVGIAGIFFLNIFRLILLYFTFKYNPKLFDLMHVYVGQTFIIFFAVLFFVLWIKTYTARYHPASV